MKTGKQVSLKRIKSYFEKLEQAFPKRGDPKFKEQAFNFISHHQNAK